MYSNVINEKEILDIVKNKSARLVFDVLSKTFGPHSGESVIGYNTNNSVSNGSLFTKDGSNVITSIFTDMPLENIVIDEFKTISNHMSMTIGDASTSTTLLASLLLINMIKDDKLNSMTPREIYNLSIDLNSKIENIIGSKSTPITPESAYNIALTSSNGDEEIAREIKSIFEDDRCKDDMSIGIVTSNRDTKIKFLSGITAKAVDIDTNGLAIGGEEIRLFRPQMYYLSGDMASEENINIIQSLINATSISIEPQREVVIFYNGDLNPIIDTALDEVKKHNHGSDKRRKMVMVKLDASNIYFIKDLIDVCGMKEIKEVRELNQSFSTDYDDIMYMSGCAEVVILQNNVITIEKPIHITSNERTQSYNSQVNWKNAFYKKQDINLHLNTIDIIDSEPMVVDGIVDKVKKLNEELDYEKSLLKPSNPKINQLRERIGLLEGNRVEYSPQFDNDSEYGKIITVLEDVVYSINNASHNGVGKGSMYELYRAIEEIKSDDVDNPLNNVLLDSIKEMWRILLGEDMLNKITSNDSEYAINILSGEPDEKLETTIRSDIETINIITRIIPRLFNTNQMFLTNCNMRMNYYDNSDIEKKFYTDTKDDTIW